MDYITPSPSPIPVVTVKFIDGSETGKTFHIRKSITTIGHELSKDIVVQGLSLAPEFARIISDNSVWKIETRSQELIVKVNQRVVNGKANLHDGDTISFGPVMAAFQFENPFEGKVPQFLPRPDASSNEPQLEITSNTSQIRANYTLPLSMEIISIGRDPSNDIVVDELVMDPFHLQILREDKQLKLVHPHTRVTSTTNGLWYQDKHIQGAEQFEHPLSEGDVFHIKNEYGTRVTLTYDGTGSTQGKVKAVETILPLDDKRREIIIGRGRQEPGGISLDHPTISQRNARLVKDRRGRYRIIDESHLGNVYVNGRAIKSRRLKPNDEIRIGPYRFVYTGPELKEFDERKSIRIDAYKLEKRGNKQTILLNDISLAVEPGSFVALVGGSGAGKTTLMDALNGLRPAHKGEVYYNGQDYYNALAAFRTQLGYVPQEDIVHKDLTVERALYYVAKLRLPKDLVQERIEKVLTDVKLEPRRTLLVKDLSGGQRKRVSIALELLAEPSIFFLDEPTSGLDPGLDRQMMDILRDLADEGHTIVLVTHATNNINVCDYVCFLCQGGRMAYFGPPQEAETYFGKSDFAEIYSYLDDESTNLEAVEARFKASDEYKKYVAGLLEPGSAPNSNTSKRGNTMPKRGNPWKQFFLLSLRYMELLKNDWKTLAILLLQAVIIAAILSLIVKFLLGTNTFDNPLPGGNAEKTLFIMAFAAVFFGSLNAAREIVKEASIYARERAVNLGIIPYFFSKFVVLGVLCLIQCAMLVLLVNLASGFRKGIFLPVLLEIYITLVLTSFVGLVMGLFVSAWAPNSDRATSLVPLLLIPQVIFSGIIFKLTGAAQILGDLFAVRWSMIGMGSSLDLNGKFVGVDSFAFEYTIGHLLLAWGVLTFMVVIFGCLTLYFLKRKDVRIKRKNA